MFKGFNVTFIYGLLDPEEGLIRYVGKTDSPQERLHEHLSRDRENSPKSRWIQGLLRNSKKPIMIILDSVNKAEWKRHELDWISHFDELFPGTLLNYKKK